MVSDAEAEIDEKQCNRCAVCRAKRKGNFLRIYLCRACAVFHRRNSTKAREFICRSGTGNCKMDREKIYACGKCRYEKIRGVLDKLRVQQDQPGPSQYIEWNYGPIPDEENFSKFMDEFQPMNVSPMLRRYSRCYNDLCRQRLVIDFGSLNDLPFNDTGRVEAQATYMNCGGIDYARTLQIEMFSFLRSASDEFAVMQPEYQMQLLTNFAKIFVPFERLYRTLKYYSITPCNRFVATFGRFADIDKIDVLYEGALMDNVFKASAVKILQEETERIVSILAPAMQRLQLTDEECIGVIALLLWHDACDSVPHDHSKLAIKNKNAILHDLYRYYRSTGLTDYSSRLGEIFMFLSLLDNVIIQSAKIVGGLKALEVFKEDAQEFINCNPNRLLDENRLSFCSTLKLESC